MLDEYIEGTQGYLINYGSGEILSCKIVHEFYDDYFIQMYDTDIDILKSKSSVYKDINEAYLALFKSEDNGDIKEWAEKRGLEGFVDYCYKHFPQYFI